MYAPTITNTFPPKANTSNQHRFCAKFFSSIACRVTIISDTFPAAFRRYLEFPTASLKIEYCHQFLRTCNKYRLGTTMRPRLAIELTDKQVFWAGLKHF